MNAYNFTERTRKVLALSREEALKLNHEYVGTEHILLGLIREGEGVAAAVFMQLNVDVDGIVKMIEDIVKRGLVAPSYTPDLPYTSRAKKVLELSMAEAKALSHSYVGTEHLLLGLLREEKGIAAQVLTESGLTLEIARAEVIRLLGFETPTNESGQPMAFTGHVTATQRVVADNGYNFTEHIRSVLGRAREEAHRLGHPYIGTEHLLLALILEGDGIGLNALRNLNIDVEAIRQNIEDTVSVGRRDQTIMLNDLPFTSLGKKALELAIAEAKDMNQVYVGTEHLLLGILREEKGIAAMVLTDAGLTLPDARAEILRLLTALNEPIKSSSSKQVAGVQVEIKFADGRAVQANFLGIHGALEFLRRQDFRERPSSEAS
jgi:ATP-dependent Clp protease ATP-binding subunit ClpA